MEIILPKNLSYILDKDSYYKVSAPVENHVLAFDYSKNLLGWRKISDDFVDSLSISKIRFDPVHSGKFIQIDENGRVLFQETPRHVVTGKFSLQQVFHPNAEDDGKMLLVENGNVVARHMSSQDIKGSFDIQKIRFPDSFNN